jgi:hypothetical protein
MNFDIERMMRLSNRDTLQTIATPLFAQVEEALEKGQALDMSAVLKTLGEGDITRDVCALLLRDLYIEHYGFAVPGTAFIDTVKPYGPILEVAAGKGVLGRLLTAAGVDCISTDSDPWDNAQNVQQMTGQEALAAYPDRNVLCAWPGYGSSWLTELLSTFRPGQHLLLIGEGYGGCTGDDALFETLETWERVDNISPRAIWSWYGIHDHLSIWKAP